MNLSILQDKTDFEALLRPKIGDASSDRYVTHFQRLAQYLIKNGTSVDAKLWLSFTPGRIEVLGKHTDYAGGYSLVCAVQYGFFALATLSEEPILKLYDLERNQGLDIDLMNPPEPKVGNWHNFAHSVVRRMTRNFGQLRGANIVFLNDLPSAAGMSSSSAFIVMLFNLLASINDIENHPEYRQSIHSLEDVATYASTLENGNSFGSLEGDTGVGTLGGSQDHTAILCSKADELNLFSYAPTVFHLSVPLPQDLIFVVANSGVKADKTGNALELYNNVSRNASQLVQSWNEWHLDDQHPHLRHFLDRPLDEIGQFVNLTSDEFGSGELITRMIHFIHENRYVWDAVKALENDDWASFKEAVSSSQQEAEERLRNQVPETIFLAKDALRCGARAASAFGAGFGGAVWALIEQDRATSLIQEWSNAYQNAFPIAAQESTFFAVRPGAPAFVLK